MHGTVLDRIQVGRIVVVAIAAAFVWFGIWEPLDRVSVIGVTALLVGGWPIYREAFANILARRMTMELSMTIAIVAAAAISEFFTALVITLFVLVAEILERLTVGRGRKAIRDLLDFVPREATIRRNGASEAVPIDQVHPDDIVLVSPGERVPVDGTVTAGYSHLDQARITGESMPVGKGPGATVYAGSINQSGALEIRVERVGRETSYGRIIEAVETAEQSRAPVQRLADLLAGYLVYFAFAAAALTYAITRNVESTISVIIVAGACGVAAGTPLAILGGIGRAAALGAIVKGGLHLETLGRVDTVVLDKTGTLTFGEPAVQTILPMPGVDPDDLLAAAATAEVRSEHPLGKAIVAHARACGLKLSEPEKFRYYLGQGISVLATGSTILVGNRALLGRGGVTVPETFGDDLGPVSEIFVARDSAFLGAVAVADTIRPEAKDAIQAMERLGIRTVLLTGDVSAVADSVARTLGIVDVEAELLPEQKLARIRGLVQQGRVVAMLGDGVNDAPALTEASVGVAMGSGTDVAQESADVVLLGNDLVAFTRTLDLARRTRRIIWQNFAGTIAVDTFGVGLAAFGFLGPLLAAFIHVTSELVFILNSARLLPGSKRLGHLRFGRDTHTQVAGAGVQP